ncbi:MAG: hypothetical protein RLZZ312_46 [Bacteroidota bacterium]|jgi:ring-1,2-phenylacetyl-CoA epoxidase subunit PaaE
MSTFYKLNISEIRRETKDAVSILFAVPDSLKNNYTFEAGQYLTLKLSLDGQEIRRAYSICSSPESGELRIAIKAVTNGIFSQFANSQLQVNQTLEVASPEGNFSFVPQIDRQRNYLAFAAGSGITPVMSILKSVLSSEPDSSFVLVYGNKSVDDTIFYNEIHELLQKYVGRFSVQYVFSQIKTDDSLFGRIDKSVVNFVLKNKFKETEFNKFYLCGPEEMISTVSDVLKSNNIADSAIKFELFTTTSFEKTVDSATDHTKVKMLVDGDSFEFEMSNKQTILEAALKQGIDAPYSCQGGICSSCLCRITEGKAEMKKNSILTDSEIAEGLVLSCQAIPTTANIFVDFDDV